MKKLLAVGSSLLVVASVAVGCVQHANFSSTDDEIETLQNPKGCLDLTRLNERILKAKNSRSTLVDVKYAGTPSDLLIMNLQDLLKGSDAETDTKAQSTPSDSVKQTDCSSLSDTSSGNEGDYSIIRSSRLMLEAKATGDSPIIAKRYKMEGPNRVRLTVVSPDSAFHVCNGSQTQETLNQTLTYVIDFGDKLPARPEESAEVASLRTQLKRVSDRVEGDRTKLINDADECTNLPSGN